MSTRKRRERKKESLNVEKKVDEQNRRNNKDKTGRMRETVRKK